jgi:type II secretory pathway pseudopilin PulG
MPERIPTIRASGAGFHCRRRRRAGGFTLIEAALTMTIVGVGVVAALQLLAAGTAANVDGAIGTTGVNLARNVREMTLTMSFDEVRDLDGKSYSPAVDSRGESLDGFEDWTQAVDVQAVNPDQITQNIVDVAPDAVRVTVTMTRGNDDVCNLVWYRFRPMP